MSDCNDPDCKFRRAHLYGRLSPRFQRLMDAHVLFAGDVIDHEGVNMSGFMNRLTQCTLYLDDLGNAYGFTATGMIVFASPGEAIEALCGGLPDVLRDDA